MIYRQWRLIVKKKLLFFLMVMINTQSTLLWSSQGTTKKFLEQNLDNFEKSVENLRELYEKIYPNDPNKKNVDPNKKNVLKDFLEQDLLNLRELYEKMPVNDPKKEEAKSQLKKIIGEVAQWNQSASVSSIRTTFLLISETLIKLPNKIAENLSTTLGNPKNILQYLKNNKKDLLEIRDFLADGMGNGFGNEIKKQIDTAMGSVAKNASYISFGIGGSFAACGLAYYAGNKYIKNYLYEPTLIAKKSESGYIRWIKSRFITPKKVDIADYMVISDALKEQLNYLMQMTKNIKKNGGQYENILLYGHPGTGKTLFAEFLALYCDMDYAIIPGSNISQFLANGTAVKELNDLFNWAEKRSRGTIIFIDEAETFLADRTTLTIEAQNALSLFLTKTGTPSNKIMIICATNRPSVLDPAVLSRLGMQINFPLPDKASREKQLKMHIHHIFGNQSGKFVAYQYLQNNINIGKIAEQLEGCSGRTIQKMVNRLRQMALAENNLAITQSLVDRVIAKLNTHLIV